MNERLARYLQHEPDLYPHELEAQFPRLIDTIADAWASPARATAVFDDLLVDRRGGRQGFPPAIAREIYRLSVGYDRLWAREDYKRDIWAHERDEATAALALIGMRPVAADMMRAAEGSDVEQLRLFLKAGMPVDTRDARDWTPLMVAAFNGKEAAAKLLIESGANPAAADRGGYTPLHWAALKGYAQVIALLVSRIDVNVRSKSGLTALLQAAASGHVEAAQALIRRGAEVNLPTNEGWTPLHKAVANGHTEVVRLLLRSGGDTTARHADGTTPFDLAKKGKSPMMVSLLRGSETPR